MPGTELLTVRAFAFGLVCGMRSLLGPALIRPHVAAVRRPGTPLRRAAADPRAAALLPLLSAGELIGDKLPNALDRTVPPSVAFRLASGAATGGVLFWSEGEPPLPGALAGALGALVATYGMYHLRRTLHERTGLPSAALGLAEDALAVTLALTALPPKRYR